MTELMKRYEAETGCTSVAIWRGECTVSDKYVDWLESQLTWRPVSEKPQEGQIVFVLIQTEWFVAQYFNGKFYIDDGFTYGERIEGVAKWLPIPPQGDKS